MADDWIQAYQIMQTIANSEELCDDFWSINFICNIRMNVSRLPYQYSNSEHSQLISASISQNCIIVHLLVEHCRRPNSSVSNQANNRQFGRILRWFWQYLFYIQYEHEGAKIALSIHEFQTYSIESGIGQEHRIIVHFVVWTWQTIEFKRIKSCKQ